MLELAGEILQVTNAVEGAGLAQGIIMTTYPGIYAKPWCCGLGVRAGAGAMVQKSSNARVLVQPTSMLSRIACHFSAPREV